MSIECTLETQSKSITLDLEEYLGDFGSFVDTLYQEFNLETPVDINTFFSVVDTDYFNAMQDVETFLSINFGYGYLPLAFLAWIYHTGKSFTDFNIFNDTFKGVFQEPKDFCKKYIEKETIINSMPTCVVECVDYQKMWDNHLNEHFYAIKFEDECIDSVSMYSYAVFSK